MLGPKITIFWFVPPATVTNHKTLSVWCCMDSLHLIHLDTESVTNVEVWTNMIIHHCTYSSALYSKTVFMLLLELIFMHNLYQMKMFNHCRAEFILGNINTYSHFPPFFNTETAQIVGTLPRGEQGHGYTTKLILCLLMYRRGKRPRHQ